MYYFLKEEKFNLEEYEFDVDLIPKFTKKEQEAFSVFLDSYKKDDFSEVTKEKFSLDKESLEKLIYNLSKKVVKIRVYKDEKEISKIFFNLFDLLVFEEEKIIYKFSKEIELTNKRGNFYSRINIIAFLQFRHQATSEIFKVILKENKREGSVYFSMKEIKEKLGMKRDKYPRYYDIEKKVFNPTIKDIEYGNINIWYEKIKDGQAKNAKIKGLKIHYRNIYHLEIHRDINSLLKKYADYIEDFTSAYEKLYDYRKLHSVEETVEEVEKDIKSFFCVKYNFR